MLDARAIRRLVRHSGTPLFIRIIIHVKESGRTNRKRVKRVRRSLNRSGLNCYGYDGGNCIFHDLVQEIKDIKQFNPSFFLQHLSKSFRDNGWVSEVAAVSEGAFTFPSYGFPW